MVENSQLIAALGKYRLSEFMTIKVKYTTLLNGWFNFQLAVPTDLRHKYTSANIKQALGTKDAKVAAPKALLLKAIYDQEFAALRAGHIQTPQHVQESAEQILKAYGLNPAKKRLVYDEDYKAMVDPDLDHFLDALTEKAQKAAGSEEAYNDIHASDLVSEAELKALEIYKSGVGLDEAMRLKNLVPAYLSYHGTPTAKLEQDANRVINKLIELFGNIQLAELTNDHIHLYKQHLLETPNAQGKKNTTGTVRRRLKTGAAAFNLVNEQKRLKLDNPFKNIQIAFEGEDAKERNPFTVEELKKLKTAIVSFMDTKAGKTNPDLRLILGMVLDTGMRLSEATGLSLADIYLDAKIPYVSIKEDAKRNRRLKTKHSIRKVPLVGMSLWAAQEAVKLAAKDQTMAFPRYCTEEGVKGDNASNAGNNWIKSRLKVGKTIHSFRHSMNDRLLEVECSEPVIEAICGWGDDDKMTRHYGQGASLEKKLEYLSKVVLD